MAEAYAQAPFLRLVRGDASDDEIAALVAALAAIVAARSGISAGEPAPSVRENWNDRSWLMRSAVHPSPGGWRRSALPH
ncbi:MAG TPA: acyl-CoA carboxylase epsilon subunit [Trebonia sp.]|nr:acyl-CoA carboxylase epsilon subunit [Trebonia sp.]